MSNQESIVSFVDNFKSTITLDGFETADDVASGFFNEPAKISKNGNVWIENRKVSDDKLEDFAEWLELKGIVEENRKILRRRDEIREMANS
jgi:hypothetical protein